MTEKKKVSDYLKVMLGIVGVSDEVINKISKNKNHQSKKEDEKIFMIKNAK